MKKLKSIRISGTTYRIRYTKMKRIDMGRLHMSKKLILINKNYHPGFQEGVLIHEICEAIKLHYSLNVSHRDLTVLSEQLNAILRDNKLLK